MGAVLPSDSLGRANKHRLHFIARLIHGFDAQLIGEVVLSKTIEKDKLRPCVKIHISKLRFSNFSLKKLLPHLQRQAVLQHSSVIRKASFLKFSAGLWNSELVFMHFLLGYKRLNRMQRRTKREAVRYSRTVLFTVLCIIMA